LHSLAAEPDLETIVVDNASADGTADLVADRFPEVRLVRSPTNLGFAGGTNLAARHASGDFLLLLNPDAALYPGALGTLLRLLPKSRAPPRSVLPSCTPTAGTRTAPSAFRGWPRSASISFRSRP
jgi:GT2 family glycosyltransferase